MKEQKLVSITALRNGSIQPINAEEGEGMGDIFAEGWRIEQMVSPVQDVVVLLLEREKPGRSGGGSFPAG